MGLQGWSHRATGSGTVIGRGWCHGRALPGLLVAALALAPAGIGAAWRVTPARAAEEPPKAEAVIARMIEATGGKAAYDKMRSRYSKGRMSVPKAGIELTLTSWAERPNKTYAIMESPALGKIETGCDGTTVWENSAMQGPSVKKGAERASQLREADFDSWVNWKKYYKSATTAGADTVAGLPAWKVEMVPMEGTPETAWFDQATGLMVKTAMKIQNEMGEIPVENFLEDYRAVCGTKMPFRTRQVMMGGMQELVFISDSVACNVEVPKDRIVIPAEIKALLDKPKAADAPAGKGEGRGSGGEEKK
jgi:hypothetical protein